MSTKPTKAQQWPKQAESVRRDTQERADDGTRRAIAARKAAESMKQETTLAHIAYMHVLFVEISRDMAQVKHGEAGVFATALRLLRALVDDMDEYHPSVREARAFLARYEEFVS